MITSNDRYQQLAIVGYHFQRRPVEFHASEVLLKKTSIQVAVDAVNGNTHHTRAICNQTGEVSCFVCQCERSYAHVSQITHVTKTCLCELREERKSLV